MTTKAAHRATPERLPASRRTSRTAARGPVRTAPRKTDAATLTVRDFMTFTPHIIGRQQTLATAHLLMRSNGIRHLPVLDGGVLVGVVSERDLHLVETLKDTDPRTTPVEEAMSPDPLTVRPETPLADAARLMHEHKTGSVIVIERDHVVGIFTAVDALRALADLAGPVTPPAVT
jgi:acetoin utilization protein AcuB